MKFINLNVRKSYSVTENNQPFSAQLRGAHSVRVHVT